MAVHPNSPEKGTNRKRKTHTKSRAGCRNCKIRRVKCDEGRPTCQKCKSYVVACSYDTGESTDDLLSSMTGAFSIKGADKIKAPSPTDLAIYNTVMSPSPLLIAKFPKTELIRQLPREDIEILGKFQNRTITTLGTTSTMGVYQREMMRLASDSPYLLHIVLTLTLMHDRYLRDGNVIEQSTAEAYHWYKGTALFNQVLRGPVKPEEKDTLWATAALLGAIAFACVDARTPEQAWPLRPATGTDLEWLRMSDGKKSVMKIADPYRPDSAFAEVAPLHRKDFASLSSTDCRIKALPDGFVKLFDLGPGSARQNNPYHSPAAVLSQLLEIECTQQTILKYLAFISFVEPEYKILLERKDSRALLLLSYWFAKICPYNQWWMQRRALLECQSICIFLQRYHWYDIEIQRLLHYPRMMCGLSTIITNKAFEA